MFSVIYGECSNRSPPSLVTSHYQDPKNSGVETPCRHELGEEKMVAQYNPQCGFRPQRCVVYPTKPDVYSLPLFILVKTRNVVLIDQCSNLWNQNAHEV